MKNQILPQHINLQRLPEQGGASFRGSLLIKDMRRLVPSLYNNEGAVEVDLNLGVDSEGLRFCQVALKGQLTLQCQRCMEPFVCEIISDFTHGIVSDEEGADQLPEQYEPLIAKEGVLVVLEMIEDELILKMPIVPMHTMDACQVKMPVIDSTWSKEEEAEKNPFGVLKLLKRETK